MKAYPVPITAIVPPTTSGTMWMGMPIGVVRYSRQGEPSQVTGRVRVSNTNGTVFLLQLRSRANMITTVPGGTSDESYLYRHQARNFELARRM